MNTENNTPLVTLERLDTPKGLAVISLNRPEALNALSPNLFIELRAHVDALAQTSTTSAVSSCAATDGLFPPAMT